MISLMILLATLQSLFLLSHLYKDLLAPLLVMIGVWGITLSLYYLKLIRYDDLGPRTVGIIALGFTSFALGSLLLSRPLKNAPNPKASLRERVSAERLFLACTAIFMIGFVGEVLYLQAVNQTLGIVHALRNPSDLHYEASVGALKDLGLVNLLASTNLVGLVLLTAFLSIFRDHKYAKFIWLQLIIALGAVLFRTSRTGVFIPVIWSMVLWLYVHGGLRINRKRLLGILMLILALGTVFLVVSSLIGKTESANVMSSYWRRDISFNASLASLYHYATSALPALQVLVQAPSDLLLGQATFLPLFRIGQLFDPTIELLDTRQPIVHVPVPTNVYTYLAPFYQDFGTVGIVLLPLVFGFVTTSVYQHWKRKPTLPFLFLSTLLTTTIFWTSFQSILGFTIIWYYAVIAFFAGRLAERPQPKRHRSRRVALSNEKT